MRTVHELLKMMLITTETRSFSCLCGLAASTQNYYEYELVRAYIVKKAKPNIFQKRYYCNSGMAAGGPYYWTPGDTAPRIEWLKRHIEKTTPKK